MSRKLMSLILLVAIIMIYIAHPYYNPLPDLIYKIAWYIVGILGAWMSLKNIIR